jgi:hypothetical protein
VCRCRILGVVSEVTFVYRVRIMKFDGGPTKVLNHILIEFQTRCIAAFKFLQPYQLKSPRYLPHGLAC